MKNLTRQSHKTGSRFIHRRSCVPLSVLVQVAKVGGGRSHAAADQGRLAIHQSTDSSRDVERVLSEVLASRGVRSEVDDLDRGC